MTWAPPVSQVAAILTLPFDVVKTQRQIELGDLEKKHGEKPKGPRAIGLVSRPTWTGLWESSSQQEKRESMEVSGRLLSRCTVTPALCTMGIRLPPSEHS